MQETVDVSDHRTLIFLLRAGGALSCTAIFVTFMPTTWIAATHEWLGLGNFPDAPITQYLARTISAIYAMFGALIIFVSTDVRRYAALIRFFAFAMMAFGVLIIGIDTMGGMPAYWTFCEGPSTCVIGVVILVLARRAGRDDGHTSE